MTTEQEPVAVTFLDLSRHQDDELKSKAKRIVARYDLASHLLGKLKDCPADKDGYVQTVLAAMDSKYSSQILAQVTPEQKRFLVPPADLAGKEQPVPTGTSQGDRYYVKAIWEPDSPETVACLTKLFNTALISKRTLTQEQALMRGRSDHPVYGYSRDWALWVASEIGTCGGQHAFVVPW